MIIAPGYIPPTSTREPERCPNCHKEEDVKEVCKHCDFEYPSEESLSWQDICMGLLFVFMFFWLIGTLLCWFANSSMHDSTLLDILKGQWEWLTNLRIW